MSRQRHGVSAEEIELLSFFACEPVQLDEGVPWAYNDNCYAVERGAFSLTFALQPSYRDVRIRLLVDQVQIYELDAMSVGDVRYFRDGDREMLELVIDDAESIHLEQDPVIVMRHRIKERP